MLLHWALLQDLTCSVEDLIDAVVKTNKVGRFVSPPRRLLVGGGAVGKAPLGDGWGCLATAPYWAGCRSRAYSLMVLAAPTSPVTLLPLERRWWRL